MASGTYPCRFISFLISLRAAFRSRKEGIWLAAWGSEMLRVLLNNLESNLDTTAFRAAVLKATGGVPADTIQLVREVIHTRDESAIERWKPKLRNLAVITAGAIGTALKIVERLE